MKTPATFLIFVIFFANISLAQNTDEASLKKVIKAQTEAIVNCDFDTWQTKWLHDSKVAYRSIGNTGEFSLIGWEKMKDAVATSVKARAKPKSFDIKSDSFSIRTDKNMAWVDFDQVITTTDSVEHKTFSHLSCVLVKQSNDWKIASMIAIRRQSSDPSEVEDALNNTGYNLLNGNKLDQAIEVFKLNVKLYPKAWNTYDSLGEAYALAGNKELAIENYKMSIELNPANDNGKKALEKLMK